MGAAGAKVAGVGDGAWIAALLEMEHIMKQWPLLQLLGNWKRNRRLKRIARQIASNVYPSLWEHVRRKLADSSDSDLLAYAKVRAAQLSQPSVDTVMQDDPTLSGAFATELLLRSTELATARVSTALAGARRRTA